MQFSIHDAFHGGEANGAADGLGSGRSVVPEYEHPMSVEQVGDCAANKLTLQSAVDMYCRGGHWTGWLWGLSCASVARSQFSQPAMSLLCVPLLLWGGNLLA